jgi:hypothetical protein
MANLYKARSPSSGHLKRHRGFAAGKVPATVRVVLLPRPGGVDGFGFLVSLLLWFGLLERHYGNRCGNEQAQETASHF